MKAAVEGALVGVITGFLVSLIIFLIYDFGREHGCEKCNSCQEYETLVSP